MLPPDSTAPTLSGNNVSAELDYTNGLVPLDKMTAPASTKLVQVTISMQYDSTANFRAFFNKYVSHPLVNVPLIAGYSTSWEPMMNSSTLFGTRASPSLYVADASQLIVTTPTIETIDFIVNSLDDGQHPFHLHGHTFFVVGQGPGRYTGQALNGKNPMRRDTVLIEPYSWMAMRFVSDNPGVRPSLLRGNVNNAW